MKAKNKPKENQTMKDGPANPENAESVGGQPASICYQEWDDRKVTDVKFEINNLIWMHCDSSLTIEEAEERACAILNLLRREPKR